ncbi:MAG: family 78 glycoside hydrolase catalytic domain [Verrucomicrobiota bacterium]|jgi:alpha-L-rhamnosidase
MIKKSTLWWLALGMMALKAAAAVSVGQLRCEYLDNPLGMDTVNPQLSWTLSSDQRGEQQTAYQILAASSAAGLKGDTGDLWDSGKVLSDETAQIAYQGKPLATRQMCFWKIRAWDHDGRPSAWSRAASWSMGLLHPADWTAQWISDPVLADPANRPMTPTHCYRSELAPRPEVNKWIVLDLGSRKRMDAVDVIPARPRGQSWDFRTAMYPLRFKVESADDRDFHDAQVLTDKTDADFPNPRGDSCRFPFAAVTARYIRLTVTRLSCWDGHDFGLALGGLAVFDGSQSIGIGAAVDCSDSSESELWSKSFLVDGQAAVALADSPALDAGMADTTKKFTVSRVPILRREFNLAGKVRRATLSVSARGFYEARLNGRRVGDELLSPGFTDCGVRVQYRTFEVTDFLHRGTNAFGALLGYGWYAGHMNLWENRCMYGYFPQFLAQLDIELADGTRVRLGTDGQWRSTLDGPVRWSDLLDGEGHDCRREIAGWDQPGFDDHAWRPAWSQPRDEASLVWARSQPVRVIREFQPVAVTEVKPGVHIFDFGQEFTGWCRLKADGPAGAHVRLRHAEMVLPDGNLDVGSLMGTLQEEDYILDGKGARTLEPHFTYHGFRYVELSGLPGKLKPDTLVAVNLRTAAAVTGHFKCSNEMYNRIQSAAAWTQANLMFDVPNGCAARSERLAWMGDIRPCVQSLMINFDAAPLLTKYVRDIRDDQTPDGRFTDIAPQAHLRGTTICVGSPGWADAGVSLPWDVYVNTGDQRLLAEHFAAAKRWVEVIHGSNPDLLWRNNRGMDWGDWLSAGAETPKELGATAFFAHSADLLSRMAQALGRTDDAKRYQALFQGIRQAFVKKYATAAGIIGGTFEHGAAGPGDAQGSYALALRFGLLDEPLRSLAARRLDELVVQNQHHPTTGFWSSAELLLALSDAGYNEDAAEMVNQREEPSWGYMAGRNTTFWEAFDADTRNLSLNHWTHSAVSEWLWRNVAGLNPDEQHSGYQSFTIRPRPSREVAWCQASYDSIRGQIASDWKRNGNKFALKITVPANATATVFVPASGPEWVTESGQPASQSAGVKLLRSEPGAVIYQVGSGNYQFNSLLGPQ